MAVTATSVGGRCVSGSRLWQQLVFGDYIVSTSTVTGYPYSGNSHIGIWHIPSSTYKKFLYDSLLYERVVQPIVMDGNVQIAFWSRSTSESGKRVRIDPSDGTILEIATLAASSTPLVYGNLRVAGNRNTVFSGGRYWGMGSDPIIGWKIGSSSVTITHGNGIINGWWWDGLSDLWTLHVGNNVTHFDLSSGSVVSSWSNIFGGSGFNASNANFVMVGGKAYWTMSGTGLIEWTPNSTPIVKPNVDVSSWSDPFLGPSGQILDVSSSGVSTWNPANGARSIEPITGVPVNRTMSGGPPLMVGGVALYPLSGTG